MNKGENHKKSGHQRCNKTKERLAPSGVAEFRGGGRAAM